MQVNVSIAAIRTFAMGVRVYSRTNNTNIPFRPHFRLMNIRHRTRSEKQGLLWAGPKRKIEHRMSRGWQEIR